MDAAARNKIADIIDAVKTDERSLDTDQYVGRIEDALAGHVKARAVPTMPDSALMNVLAAQVAHMRETVVGLTVPTVNCDRFREDADTALYDAVEALELLAANLERDSA